MMKINKTKARNLYNKGATINLLPCKVRFENMWIQPHEINMNDENLYNETFDLRVNYFEHYNCNYNETGKYSAYYVLENDIQ